MKQSPLSLRGTVTVHRQFVFLLILACISVSSGLEPQAIRGLESLSRIDTASFSIYYPSSMEAQAEKLARIADGILSDLESLFNSSLSEKKFPVLLSDVSYRINGYFSSYPSNRIVLYLSAAAGLDELSSFEDELYSVFLHELVHALTMNERSQGWKILSWLFGDSIAPTAWIMPNALIEGTAVWAESRPQKPSGVDPSKRILPSAGRLNDPGALEPVFSNLSRGISHDLWDASGLTDYPGSGAYPYLYGALFVQFLESRYGTEGISLLWKLASKGNIFRGFEGTLFGTGILGDVSRQSLEKLWPEFNVWLAARLARFGGRDSSSSLEYSDLDIPSGRIGPFALQESTLYYVDNERKAVFSIEDRQKPKRLFASDAWVESMTLSPDGKRLMLDWARAGSLGLIEPARYSYDINSNTLVYEGKRETPLPGTALESLKPGTLPHLYTPHIERSSGITYGLARLGTIVLPARLFQDGAMEVLDLSIGEGMNTSPSLLVAPDQIMFENIAFRSLAVDPFKNSSDTTRIALSCYTPDYAARLGILEGQRDNWVLLLQKNAPPGGVKDPVIEGNTIIFRSDSDISKGEPADGSQTLRKTIFDPKIDREAFYEIEVAWVALEAWKSSIAAEPETGSAGHSGHKAATMFPGTSLFPRLMSTTRYPYADSDSIGLVMEGMDLTERLSFEAAGGWHFEGRLPEFQARIQVSAGWSIFSAMISDEPIAQTPPRMPVRLSRLALEYQRMLLFNPLYSRGTLSAYAFFAGIEDGYALADYFKPDYEYSSIGFSIRTGYSSRRSEVFAPFDPIGFSVSCGFELERLKNEAPSLSLSSSMTLAPQDLPISVGIYGALSLSDTLRFLPAQRRIITTNGNLPSALSPPFPVYREYADIDAGSPWYIFGQASFRIWNIELAHRFSPIALPFLPSLAFRRATFRVGYRLAALESASVPITPMSAFLRIDLNAAVLAGLAAEANLEGYAEMSYALSDSLPGGGAIYMDFGFGVSY